jgi:hypothetical protein
VMLAIIRQENPLRMLRVCDSLKSDCDTFDMLDLFSTETSNPLCLHKLTAELKHK